MEVRAGWLERGVGVMGGRRFFALAPWSPTRDTDLFIPVSEAVVPNGALCCSLVQMGTSSIYLTLQVCLCVVGSMLSCPDPTQHSSGSSSSALSSCGELKLLGVGSRASLRNRWSLSS